LEFFPSKYGKLMALFYANFFEKSKSWFLVKIWQNFATEKTLEWDIKILLLIRGWNGEMLIPFNVSFV